MRVKRLEIIERRKHYLDNLGQWVEVPVWDQKDLIHFVNEINWEELLLDDYKKLLVEHWPGLPNTIKTKLDNPAVRNELYEVLIHENWGLVPSDKTSPEKAYYTEVEQQNVQLWFRSNKRQGQQPTIID